MPGLLGFKVARRLHAELRIAAAMARERIVETHVKQLLELIQLASDQLPAQRTIEIYVRLHSVDQETTRLITSMALAALGRQREITVETPTTEPPDTPRSLFGLLTRRLRGRVYHELRQQIEFHTGRTQVAFLHIHVDNALRFVRILTPDHTVAMAVELYTELVQVPRPVSEVIYFLVLDRLSGSAARRPEHEPELASPPVVPAQHTLRVVNNPR